MSIFPPTAKRVALHTSLCADRKIKQQTRLNLQELKTAVPGQLVARLNQLDREWDTERVLETNASGLILAGLALGACKDRRWYLLSAGVAAFLLQHAIQGWCPPLPIIRALGVRTAQEIEEERSAVKDLLSHSAP